MRAAISEGGFNEFKKGFYTDIEAGNMREEP